MGDALADYMMAWITMVVVVTIIASISVWELGWFLWRHIGFTWS